MPQGSCLGPLIFLIFCNNLHLHLSLVSTIQFADDTSLYVSLENKNYLQFCMEYDLNTLHDWFTANRLTLNVKKSVIMIFEVRSTGYNPRIKVGSEYSPVVTSTKISRCLAKQQTELE